MDKYKEAFEKWYFKQILVDEVPVYVNQVKYKYFKEAFIMAREKKTVHKVQMTDGKRQISRVPSHAS